MSNTSTFLLSGRNDDLERHNQGSNANQPDAKQSTEAVLAESKRLIKSGFYKKAFNLVEAFKSETSGIPPVAHIKLCRRMVICLSRICTRYLNKGDLHRVDHFIKLMNKSYEYLQIWNDLLCGYISRTNPKFKHLQKLLDEASESYEDTLETEGIVRVKLGRTATQNNSSFFSTNDSRETRPSSFMNKLKPSLSVSNKENRPVFLEDTASNYEPEVKVVTTETLTGQEINTTFHLDEFIRYYLINLMTWVSFFKRVTKKYDSAYRFLLLINKFSKELDSCLDPDLLHLIGEARLALGAFYSEFGKQEDAIKLFESSLNILQIEISLRISRSKDVKDTVAYMLKLKEAIHFLILCLINMSVIYEQRDNYSRVLESLKLGTWFAGKFLANDDEVNSMVKSHFSIATQKYDRYLKELGEIERFAGNKTGVDVVEDIKGAANSDHFARMNNHLYNKFNYDKLNSSQYIVMTSPANMGPESATRRGNNRSEVFMDDKFEFSDPKTSWSRVREMQSDGSIVRGTANDDESPNAGGLKKRSSMTTSKGPGSKKKATRLKLSLMNEEMIKTLTSEKYHVEGGFDKDREDFQIDSEEEREHIEKLNRNIKDRKKQPLKKHVKSKTHDYLDVDDYFLKLVDKKIEEKEEELKLNQPTEFKEIVKNYAFFRKTEKFDDIEFQFATKTLTAKARENLGEYTVSSKYKPPSFITAQRNEVKIEAQHIEAKLDAETKINQRNVSFKNMMQSKSPQSKTVKFASPQPPQLLQPEEKEPKIATLVQIDEQPPTTRTVKHTFTSILMKHKDNLGLNAIHSTLKEREKVEQKEKKLETQKTEMKKLGLLQALSPKALSQTTSPKGHIPNIRSLGGTPHVGSKGVDPELMKKFSQTTKNTIQLLMESIEKNIDDDQNIKRRIEDNKPLVEIQQPNKKFLKGLDELSKSTVNLSIKSDGKKVKNFTEVVKNMQLLIKRSVTIKTPKMGS